MPPLASLVFDVMPLTPSELRWELAGVAIGVILLSIGLGALAVFLFRAGSDLTLAYFASFCILYSIRMLSEQPIVRLLFPLQHTVWDGLIFLIDCFIVVPFTLFLIQIIEPRWRNILRWLVAAQIAFGAVRL